MHIIFETVLMLRTENYQNWPMLVEATACQIGAFFETQCSIVTARDCLRCVRYGD